MANDRVFNFSAGPSMLPLEVLQRAGAEITNYGGSGMSVMEMSHRSKIFLKIFDETQEKFRKLLGVPEGYKVLFLQGGGTMQFGMIPLNLIGKTGQADYAVTGHFANLAMKEAKKYGQVTIAASSEDRKHVYIPAQEQLKLNPDASYFYYCSNNTIEGTQWQYVPETGSVPLACDMSSDILSRPVDVSKFGLIFAGAQKNLAPAGLTIVIIREDLAGQELPITPAIMNYKSMIDKDSMYNTPPLLVHLHAGSHVRLAGAAGRRGRHGEDQPEEGPDALRRTGQCQALHRLRRKGLPLPHERDLPLRLRGDGRQICGRVREGGLHQPEGPPVRGRHAGLHLQRHAHRGCGEAV